eukprot:TCALIF_06532-PA protein Name:"Protein of unknown function" AED:0.04 eAED:0.04 QI:0/0.66/0.25/0.75/0.66/0.75/4/29/238
MKIEPWLCLKYDRSTLDQIMKYRLVVLVLTLFICDIFNFGKVVAVKCFFCSVRPPSKRSGQPERLCSHFDEGPNFEIDCPLSTLCQTRTFTLQTHSGSISITTRGCAQQDYAYQSYSKAEGWTTVQKINETVYSEGCSYVTPELRLRRHKTKYCFCPGDLCNKGHHHYDTNITTNNTSSSLSVEHRWKAISLPLEALGTDGANGTVRPEMNSGMSSILTIVTMALVTPQTSLLSLLSF